MNKQQEPRLRFKGFTGAWEEKKLEDIFNTIRNAFVGTATPYYVENGHFYLESNNIKNGEINKNSQIFINDEFYYKQQDKWLKTNDLVMVQSGHVGHCAVIPEELNNVAAHALIMFSNYKSEANPYFLSYQFQTNSKINEIAKITTGNTIKHILSSDMKEFVVDFPMVEEQTQLGNFFRRLDSQIAESRAVLEKSRQLKKAMLVKMFPANGEKIPKIRFKGFEGEWERNELGCLGYCLSGIGFSENEQGGENGIPFFKVSDMNLSGNEIYLRKANNYVTQEQIDKQRWQVIQQLPCIFFAKVGAALLLNRKRLVNTPFLLDNNTMAFILDSSLDNYFMKTLFDTIDLPALAQIGALPSINAKDIEKNIVFIPTPKEQSAIGNFFRQLDETIALQSTEIEKLNQLKKGLLAAMLV